MALILGGGRGVDAPAAGTTSHPVAPPEPPGLYPTVYDWGLGY